MKHLKITIGRCRIYGGLFAMVDFVFFHFRNCRDDDDRQIKRKTQIYLLKLFAPSTNTEEHDLRLNTNKKYRITILFLMLVKPRQQQIQ